MGILAISEVRCDYKNMLTRQNRIRTLLLFFFALVVVAPGLVGCASQPSGNHSFAIAADGSKKGRWALAGLAAHGRIDMTAHLIDDGGEAAKVTVNFGNDDMSYSQVALFLGDSSCEGAYWMSLSHKLKAKSAAMDHLTTRLPWADALRVQAEWWPDGRFTITINGVETRTLQLQKPIKDMIVDTYRGGVHADSVTYTSLEQ